MVYPKMILFDYGHTLLHEPDFDTLRGEEALLKYVKSNKNNYTAKDINDFSQGLFTEISVVRDMGFELHEWQFQRFLYDYLDIELSVSLPEAERIFWDNTSYGDIMPNADKMIDYINSCHIRSAIISNIGFSGAALTERINRLLPNNRFEFIIASSDYMFRKPNHYLFQLALKKARLNASEVWFCGDNVEADIEGAANVGIFPIWYENLMVENQWNKRMEVLPKCKHLHIHEWNQLIEILEKQLYGKNN
ncbi:MAG TPA: HAD family hydrolase [Clostridiales bacterium]|nr:HAD family hydrolase [Clostridiales bacterium]